MAEKNYFTLKMLGIYLLLSLYRNMNVIILGLLKNSLNTFWAGLVSLLTKNESFYLLDKYALKILFLYTLLTYIFYCLNNDNRWYGVLGLEFSQSPAYLIYYL